jgi:hypothetical protein
MKAADSSQTLVPNYQNTWAHIPDTKNPHAVHLSNFSSIFHTLFALVTPTLVASPAAGYDSGDIRVTIVRDSVVLISCAIVHISKSV